MKIAIIFLIVCVILTIVATVVYAVEEYLEKKKIKTAECPFYCKKPEFALDNHCNYFGAFDDKCLCPYEGCNLQGLESERRGS